MATHPAMLFRRHAEHHCVIRHIISHNGTCSNKGISTNRNTTDNGSIGANGGASPDKRFLVQCFPNNLGTRIRNVCQNAGGAKEHIVLDGDTVVNGHIVLDLNIVTYDAAGGDHCVLAKGTACANLRASAHVAKMPDTRACANLTGLIDDGGRMDVISAHLG